MHDGVGQASGRAGIAGLLALALIVTALVPGMAQERGLSHVCPPDELPRGTFVDGTGPHGLAIDCLAWLGVTEGRTAEVFGTGRQLTRGQLARLADRVVDLVPGAAVAGGDPVRLTDIEGHPHQEAIERLAAQDPPVLRGHEDLTFRPDAAVRRDQAAAVLVRLHALLAAQLDGLAELAPGTGEEFVDLADSTHAADVGALASVGVLAGYPDGTFRPGAPLTRGQGASVLARHVDLVAAVGGLEPPVPPEDPEEPDVGNPWLEQRRVANIAHAGGIHEAAQNTLYAFRTAEARGADVLEMDLHATADGHVVAIHDSTVDRTTDGTGCVVDHTLEELRALDAAHTHVDGEGPRPDREPADYLYRGIATGEREPPEGFAATDFRVPTLAEIFEALPDALMVVEIKPTEAETRGGVEHDCPASLAAMAPDERPELVAEVARLIDEHDMTDRIMVASFIDRIMDEFVSLAPEVDTAFPLVAGYLFYLAFESDDPAPPNPHGHVALQAPLGLSFAGVELEASKALVDYAREHGVAVHFWTVNDPDAMTELLDWGADGIITDEVRLLDELLTLRGDPRP
jgi:glycerophosphoryl diester phosphodiesterase